MSLPGRRQASRVQSVISTCQRSPQGERAIRRSARLAGYRC